MPAKVVAKTILFHTEIENLIDHINKIGMDRIYRVSLVYQVYDKHPSVFYALSQMLLIVAIWRSLLQTVVLLSKASRTSIAKHVLKMQMAETCGVEEGAKERRRICQDPRNTARQHVSGVWCLVCFFASNNRLGRTLLPGGQAHFDEAFTRTQLKIADCFLFLYSRPLNIYVTLLSKAGR